MSRVELNIVALGDFSSVNAQLKSLQTQIDLLNKSVAGVGLGKQLTQDLNSVGAAFKSTLMSTGAFTQQTVQLTSETQKFGKALQDGKLHLGDYYNIIKNRSSDAVNNVKALAIEQTKLQNSVIMADPTKKGFYSVFTPNTINKIADATKIAANEQNIYNIAVEKGSQSLINWGKNTQWAGRQLTVGMSVPLTIFGSQATKIFQDVNAEIVRLQKVYGTGLQQPSQQALDAIKNQTLGLAKELASSMGIAVKDTASMAADLAATGKTGNDLIVATREAMRLAKLGEMDTQQAMQTTISLQNVYKLNTNQLADAVNFLNAVENQTSTSLQDLAAGIPKVGPIVQQLGGSFKDTAVMMVAMKEAGVPAAQSANAIKSAIASMINPTKAAKEAFAAYNIGIDKIATNDKGNPVKMIMDLQQALKGLAPLAQAQLIEKLFGKFQEARIQALITNLGAANSQTKTAFDLMNANSTALAGVANAEMKTATESATGKYKRAMETFKADLIPVGEKILDFGTKLLNFGNSLAKLFGGLPGPVKTIMGALAIGVALSGPLIMLTGLVANFVGYLLKGVFNLKALATGGKTLGQLFTPEMIAAKNATDAFSSGMLQDVSSIDLLSTAIKELTSNIEAMALAMNSGTGIKAIATVAAEAKTFTQMRLPGFAGGFVPGSGDGSKDTYPAMLAPGEAVIDAETTRKYMPFIKAMMYGNLPGYSDGNVDNSGIVSGFMSRVRKKRGAELGVNYDIEVGAKPSTQRQDMSVEEKGSYRQWLQGWLTKQVEIIKSANPNISLDEVNAQLELAYKKIMIPIEELPKDLQAVAQRRLDKLNALPKNAVEGAGLSGVIPARGIASYGYLQKEYSTEFAHVGTSGQNVPVGSINMDNITDPAMRRDLENMRRINPDKEVGLHGGLGFSQAGWINNKMQRGGSVSTADFATDYNSRGVGKWDTAFGNVNLKIKELDKDTQKAIEDWDKAIMKSLEGNATITEEDFAKAEQKVRAEMAASGDVAKQKAAALITSIDNVLTEVRVAIDSSEESIYKGQIASVAVGSTSRAGRGGSAAYRGDFGAGQIANAENIAIMETEGGRLATALLDGQKKRLKINSPSKAEQEEIAAPAIQGVQQGIQDALPGLEEAGIQTGQTLMDGQKVGIRNSTPEVIAQAERSAEEVAAASTSRFKQAMTGKFAMSGGMMALGMAGSMVGGGLGSALGSAGSMAGMAGMFAPAEFANPIMAGVAALSLAYSGVSKLIAIEKDHAAQAKAQFQISENAMSKYADQIDKADTALTQTLTDLNKIPNSKTVTVTIKNIKAGKDATSGNTSYSDKQILDEYDRLEKGLITSPKSVESAQYKYLKGHSGEDAYRYATNIQSTAVAQGIDPAKIAADIKLKLLAAGQGDIASKFESSTRTMKQSDAIARYIESGLGKDARGQFKANSAPRSQANKDLGYPQTSASSSAFMTTDTMNHISKLTGANTGTGLENTLKVYASAATPLEKTKQILDGVAKSTLNLKGGTVAVANALKSAGGPAASFGKQLAQLSQFKLTDALKALREEMVLNALAASGDAKAVAALATATAAAQKAGETLSVYMAKHPNDFAKYLTSDIPGLTKDGKPIVPTPTPDPGAGGTFTGTKEEKAIKKILEARVKSEDSILKTLKDQLTVEKQKAAEVKRQMDYKIQMESLNQQSKQALISGDYLQAAMLGQQAKGATVDFNATTEENIMQGKIDTIQARTDVFSQALADLNDAIANGVKTINKSIASAVKLPELRGKDVKVDSAGITVNVAVQPSASDHNSIAAAAAAAAHKHTLKALQTHASKTKSGNKVTTKTTTTPHGAVIPKLNVGGM